MIKPFFVSGAMCAMLVLAAPANAQTIVEVAQSDQNTFSSLVDAVVARDLAGTLSGEGPFTVFAPTNAAFAALPGYVGKAIADNPALLTDVLLYHVVPGELLAAGVLAESSLTTAQGENLRVSASPNPRINNSNIVTTDVRADNGVIHAIDRVLIPNKVYDAALNDVLVQLRDALRAYVTLLTERAADTH